MALYGLSRIYGKRMNLAILNTNYQKNLVFKTMFHKQIKFEPKNISKRFSFSLPKNEIPKRIVGKWLLCCSGMVYIAVLLGGVTRLTESGLSMVSWKFLGEKMPLNQSDWEKEFLNYQKFPEFKMKNTSMTIEEFKFIYIMEYAHRLWGRAIGACFLIPAFVFWKRGYFCMSIKKYIFLIGALLSAQGLMGWYMVKSGLEDKFLDVNDVPKVSQYRLASHLGLAFVVYALCLSKGLSILLPHEKFEFSFRTQRLIKYAHLSKGLIFLTAISGAFVAGLDAGLVYNTFPKMGDNWVPEDIFALEPIQKNFTENPTTVQFDHRILGISTLCLVSVMWILSRGTKLPKRSYWAINAIAVVAWTQAILGITTLLNHVPVSVAAAHQTGSLLLLSIAIWLTHELRYIKYIPK